MKTTDYDFGYRDGESSCMADWIAALQEIAGWPDDVEVTPTAVALRLKEVRLTPTPSDDHSGEQTTLEEAG